MSTAFDSFDSFDSFTLTAVELVTVKNYNRKTTATQQHSNKKTFQLVNYTSGRPHAWRRGNQELLPGQRNVGDPVPSLIPIGMLMERPDTKKIKKKKGEEKPRKKTHPHAMRWTTVITRTTGMPQP